MMAVRAMRVFLFFFLLLGGFVCAFLRERGVPFGRGGLRCAVMVGRVLGKRGSGFCAVSDGKTRRQSPAGGLVVAFLFCSIIFRFVPVGVLRLSGRTLRRAEVLDRSGIYVAGLFGPLFASGGKGLERCSV